MDLTSSYGDLPPAVQAAMKQRAAQVFDLSSTPPQVSSVSLESVGVPAERRHLPSWALWAGLAAGAGLVWYATKKSRR